MRIALKGISIETCITTALRVMSAVSFTGHRVNKISAVFFKVYMYEYFSMNNLQYELTYSIALVNILG